jgi:hypothetical protein
VFVKIPGKVNLKEGKLISEISVQGHLAPFFLSHSKAEYHGKEQVVEQSCLPHGNWEAERERGRDECQISPSKAYLMIYFLQQGPTF